MEDREIVELFWKRSEKAIDEAASKYGKYCRRIAVNILENEEDADEALNETWLNAWNSMPPHRPAVLRTFLGKITRYICLKKWRERSAHKRGGGNTDLVFEELEESIPDGSSLSDAVEAKELAEMINDFLFALPEVERYVFVCRYYYLDSISEIGERFGFGESKVKTMLWRTRKKLAARLKKEGVFDEK